MEGPLPIFNFSHTAILGWLSSFLKTAVLPQLILKHLSLYIWRMVIDKNTEFKIHIHTHTKKLSKIFKLLRSLYLNSVFHGGIWNLGNNLAFPVAM